MSRELIWEMKEVPFAAIIIRDYDNLMGGARGSKGTLDVGRETKIVICILNRIIERIIGIT